MLKKKLQILDMHCSSCSMLIDGDLEDLDGVISARTTFAKAECEIEFDEKVVKEQQIIETIKKTGYRAKPIL
ncbi:heavy-metal-associated domain-containing protein [Candidatus Daviesbacteria bacterium]|nr:heavy-metal-associated domain-containing protein [Candidatus Daviesbacteria bacterium]